MEPRVYPERQGEEQDREGERGPGLRGEGARATLGTMNCYTVLPKGKVAR